VSVRRIRTALIYYSQPGSQDCSQSTTIVGCQRPPYTKLHFEVAGAGRSNADDVPNVRRQFTVSYIDGDSRGHESSIEGGI